MKLYASLLSWLIVLVFVAPASADLIVRGTDTLGNKLIYDTDLDVTWYDFTNGPDHWDVQNVWVETLVVNFDGFSYNDWRLPGPGVDYGGFGYYDTQAELGHLFYIELGNEGEYNPWPIPNPNFGGITNKDVFDNIVFSYYWDSYRPASRPYGAGFFLFSTGRQSEGHIENDFSAIAVRDGDMVPTPIPGAAWLLGSGIVALVTRKRKHR